jgi:Domain of unknown function (DUF4157)
MAALDYRSRDSAADSELDSGSALAGRATLVEVSSGSEFSSSDDSSSEPGRDEEPFDFTGLAGSFDGHGIAAGVLEQEPESEDMVNPDAAFTAATSGPGQEIPHRVQMQQAFGRPLDDVTAYLGASGPLQAMDAEAAARGNQIAFDSSTPSPELVAHELAHVEQNRQAGGAGRTVHASGRVSDPSAGSEIEAERVGAAVAAGHAAPAIQAAPGAGVQRSFISFVVKAGAKKASKGMLKNFIKTRIKDKIKNMTKKELAQSLLQQADDIMSILEDPWWVTAIGFVPVVGDAFDLVNVPLQIKRAIDRADALENTVKRAIDAEQAVSRAVKWFPYKKHIAQAGMAWNKVVESTRKGPARYLHGTDIESLERSVWANGKKVTNGKSWKVMDLGREIGASEGKSSRWMRVEYSAETIHGHPISQAEFLRLSQ